MLKQRGEEAFCQVHAVFGLGEHDTLGSIDDVIGDFESAFCGEVVHEDGGGGCEGHEAFVYLVVCEGGFAAFGVFFLSHAGPDVGVDDVGSADSQFGIGGAADLMIGVAAGEQLQELGCEEEVCGTGECHGHAGHGGGNGERHSDVVAIADEDEVLLAGWSEDFADGEQVGEGLTGVAFVGEAIDDGAGGVFGDVFDELLGEGAHGDEVGEGADDACDIGDAFATIETGFGGGEEDAGPAKVDDGGFEAVAGAEGGFFEELYEDAAGKQLGTLALFEKCFQFEGSIEDGVEFVGCEIEQGGQMLHDPGAVDTGLGPAKGGPRQSGRQKVILAVLGAGVKRKWWKFARSSWLGTGVAERGWRRTGRTDIPVRQEP